MIAKHKYPFQPDYAVPPGATLEETMETLGMTQRDLADRTGLTVQTLNRIFKGEQPITYETANKLELVTGTPATFWNNLEAQYRAQLKKLEVCTVNQQVTDWVSQFNYARMALLGWLPAARSVEEKFGALLAFFGVADIESWESAHLKTLNQGAYRLAPAVKEHRTDTTAWIQRGLTLARGLQPAAYDEKRFKEAVRQARALATENPVDVVRKLEELYREAGVALVFLDTLPGMGVHGLARWVKGGNYAVILHGLRFKTNDHFWFDLFHESAHILLHGRSHEFIEYDGLDDPREIEANQWAGDFLLPKKDWQRFVSQKPLTAARIQSFAEEEKVHPGTIVGRLQKERRLRPQNHTKLKIYLKDDVEALTTSPARRRIRRERLGIGSPSVRRNKGTHPSMEAIRDSISPADHESLRR